MWYSTGTISVTNGSSTVTGVGTDFIAGAKVGEALQLNDKLYEIQAVTSATSLTLSTIYVGATQVGASYKIIPTQSLTGELASAVTELIADYSDVKDLAGSGKFADGTEGSPAISFNADQNNGIYREDNDTWGLSAGGAAVVKMEPTKVEITQDLRVDKINMATNTSLGDITLGSRLHITGDPTTSEIQSHTQPLKLNPAGQEVQVGADLDVNGTVKSTGIDVNGTVSSGDLKAVSGTSRAEIKGDDWGTILQGGMSLYENNFYLGGFYSKGNGVAVESAFNGTITFSGKSGTTNSAIEDTSEYGRFTSSGDLLVGKNTASHGAGTSGFLFQPSGNLYIDGGTSSASIILGDDTGSYTVANDRTSGSLTVSDSTGGERIRLDANGNLGLGTSSPHSVNGTNLHIYDATATPRLILEHGSGKKWGWFASSDGGLGAYNYTDNTNPLAIDSSGNTTFSGTVSAVGGTFSSNVGIGTSSPNAYGNVNTLTINGSSGSAVDFEVDGDLKAEIFTHASGLTLNAMDTHSIIFTTASGSERARLTSDGKFGLGTSSPNAKLELATSVPATTSTDSESMRFHNTSDGGHSIGFYNGIGKYAQLSAGVEGSGGYTDDGVFAFSTAVNGTLSEKARLTSDGEWLVGTTTTFVGYGNTDTGVMLHPAGQVMTSRGNGVPLYANRSGSDGGIISLRKDGYQVAELGVVSSDNLYISGNSTHAGLAFGTAVLVPFENGDYANGSISLGQASQKFKDAHFSGTVNSASATIAADNAVLKIQNTTDLGKGAIEFWDNQGGSNKAAEISYSDSPNMLTIQGNGNGIKFYANNTFPSDTVGMHLKANGHLDVGGTVNAPTFNGSSAGIPAQLNKVGVNGDVLLLKKDNSNVGTLGVAGADMYLQGKATHAGLHIGTTALTPRHAGTLKNGTVDIGSATYKFKDAHFSGSVYQGGVRKLRRRITNGVGAGAFPSMDSTKAQSGFLYAFNISTGHACTYALHKKGGINTIAGTLISQIGNLAISAMNSGGTITMNDTSTNVHMVIETIIVQE